MSVGRWGVGWGGENTGMRQDAGVVINRINQQIWGGGGGGGQDAGVVIKRVNQ